MFNNNLKVWENGELITAEKLNSLEKKVSPFYITINEEYDEETEESSYNCNATYEEIIAAIENNREVKVILYNLVGSMYLDAYDSTSTQFDFYIPEGLSYYSISLSYYNEELHTTVNYYSIWDAIPEIPNTDDEEKYILFYKENGQYLCEKTFSDLTRLIMGEFYSYGVRLRESNNSNYYLIGEFIKAIMNDYGDTLSLIFLFKSYVIDDGTETHYYITIDSSNNITMESLKFAAKTF